MWNLGGHLGGSVVTALVDGQLDAEASERAWSHVNMCPACRRAVEHEGWVKRKLSRMGGGEPSARLLGSLYELDHADPPTRPSWESLEAWAAVEEIERKGRTRRRAGLVLVGAGGVSAAVFGLASLSGSVLGIGEAPAGPPAASLTGPSAAHTHAVLAPTASVHGRIDRHPRATRSPGDRSDQSGRQRDVALLSRR